jgi:hypothetical protein
MSKFRVRFDTMWSLGNVPIYYDIAVTTLRQMRQMPHTQIDDFLYTKNLFKIYKL